MAAELVSLRSFYADPGFLLLATRDGEAIGCVGLRSLGAEVAEVRRLYVSPTARSDGLGRRLMSDLISEAQSRDIKRLVLNTLPTMAHAQALYGDLGFEAIAPYVDEPTEGVLYFGRALAVIA